MQLIAEHLTIHRGARAIVLDLSFVVESGRVLLLEGANGSGKTTLLRAVAGFIPLQSGTVRLTDGGDDERPLRERCHAVGHVNAVKPLLTVRENIRFWIDYLGDGEDAAAAADAALGEFELAALADFPAGALSAGQKRRLGLARLATARRDVWLLDEPTVSLDTASSALVARAVDRHTALGGIAVIATHVPLAIANASSLKVGTRGGVTAC